MIAIYGIFNKINNKVYIGQSINVDSRISEHQWMLSKGIHTNSYLQNDWDKYGKDNFEFCILEVLPNDCTSSLRFTKESQWIANYGGVNSSKTYNFISSSDFGGHSQESKDKISTALKDKYRNTSHPTKGRKGSIIESQRKSVSHLGNRHSEETKRKIKEGNIGKILSETTRQKISRCHKGKPSPMKGKHVSAEALEHIRSAVRNRHQICSEETRKKISEANKNHIIRPVAQYTLDGDMIAVFKSAVEASTMTGCPKGGIYSTCLGTQNKSHGYIWKYISKLEYFSLCVLLWTIDMPADKDVNDCTKEEFDSFYDNRY